ncbi:ATP-dependent RecD-like DNA helicase, partial [Streptococcus gallolyticus]
GEIAAFDYAIKNEGAKRNTYLVQRFTSSAQEEESIDLQTEISQQTSPKTDNEAEKITSPTSPQTNISKEENIQLTLDIAENEQTQTEQ